MILRLQSGATRGSLDLALLLARRCPRSLGCLNQVCDSPAPSPMGRRHGLSGMPSGRIGFVGLGNMGEVIGGASAPYN